MNEGNESGNSLEQRILELTEENNKLLHQMRRSQKMASIMRALYWVVIIGLAFGSFYFIQPYIDSVKESVDGIQGVF